MRRRNQILFENDNDAWKRVECVIKTLNSYSLNHPNYKELLRAKVRCAIADVHDQARRLYLIGLLTRVVRATMRRCETASNWRQEQFVAQLHFQEMLREARSLEAVQPTGTCEGALGELSPDHVT